MQPKVFITSSVEGLEIANAIQQNLKSDAEVIVWAEGVFNISEEVLSNLIQASNTSDFGVFVLSPSDIVEKKDRKTLPARDNLMLEIGMFIGKLGINRVFLIAPKGQEDLNLPTELIGVSKTTFNPSRSDKTLQSVLGSACEHIRTVVRSLGPREISEKRGSTSESREQPERKAPPHPGGEKPKPKTEKSPPKDDGRQLFISYSHKDQIWLERLNTMLTPLAWNERVNVWDDTKIKPGDKWKKEIASALDSAKVAVLLVSPHFLASGFIATNELPPILNAAQDNGLTIIWALLSSCLYKQTQIKNYQAAHNIQRPLDLLAPGKRNLELSKICQAIGDAIGVK